MSTPKNADEYAARFHENNHVTGFGVGNVFCHVPCPFCAAPRFMTWEILQVEKVMAAGATCRECNRSAKAIFKHNGATTTFEFVQTGGPDQPDWFEPKMRRVE